MKYLKIIISVIFLTSCNQEKQELIVDNYPSILFDNEIVEPTTYHGTDLNESFSSKWIGLFYNGNGFYVEPTKIKRKRVYDEVFDRRYEKTGIKISVKNKNCKFLIGGLQLNNASYPLKIKSIDFENELNNNSKINFLGNDYLFKFKNGETYIITNREGKEYTQLLSSSNCQKYQFYFMGDLNLDGKLDIIMDTGPGEGAAKQLTLFLSSDDILKLAALTISRH